MILVITPFYHTYEHYLRERNLNPMDYKYIHSEDSLRGYKPGTRVERIGYWDQDIKCLKLLEIARTLGYKVWDVRA